MLHTQGNTGNARNQAPGIDIRGIDRQEWLELRRGGIGGSDAAALMGAEGELLDRCVLYARIVLCALPFFMLQNMFPQEG